MASRTSVLITGCTPGGIGHALALEFHKRGCHVIATARRLEVLADLAAMGMSTLPLDVTSKESIDTAKVEVEKLTGGRLDILVNNAGRSHPIPAVDFELEDLRKTYETNVFGPMLMVQAFIHQLIAARGLILNISSATSVIPYLFGGMYSSSKSALNNYSRALRMELAPFNVRVMVSMTGTVRSNIGDQGRRLLPPSSLYQPVQDFFERRIVFSQNVMTMPNEKFAEKLVTQALKGEGWLGGWFGRTPDWYWAGGASFIAWLSSCMPAWLGEKCVAIFFKMPQISRQIRAAREKKD